MSPKGGRMALKDYVLLKNGAEESEILMDIAVENLHVLSQYNRFGFYTLLWLCKGNNRLPVKNVDELTGDLADLRFFLKSDGSIIETVRNIVLSAIERDDTSGLGVKINDSRKL
jgi:hypothetical protein